jgi:tetratricopeptide (TPR) repeat protein
MKYLFTVSLFILRVITFAQGNANSIEDISTMNVDDLKLALMKVKSDSERCYILYQLTELTDENEWPKYNEELKKIVELKLSNPEISESLRKYYTKGYAYALNNLGYLLNLHGDVSKSIEYYNLSLKYFEQLNDKSGIALLFNNLGAIYDDLKEEDKARLYYSKSLAIRLETNDKEGIATCYNNLANLYSSNMDYAMSSYYYLESMKIFVEINDSSGIALALNNLGYDYQKQNKNDSALMYYKKSLIIREKINDKEGASTALNNIGATYFYLNKLKPALDYSVRALKLCYELNYPSNIKSTASILYKIYKKSGISDSALKYHEIYIQMRDSINNESVKKASIKSQLKYEYEKKAAADSVKAVEEKKVTDVLLKQEKTQRFALYGGLGLVGLFAMFMVNRFQVTNKQKRLIEEQKRLVEIQKHMVEEKQKEILDSIKYAKRIQFALITSEYYFSRNIERLKL